MKEYKYDVIVIGAGIGGLFCTNYLAKENKTVLLLEQHKTPGGYICGFYRKNYYFDGANNSFSSHGSIFPLLKEIGLDKKIKFHKHRVSQKVESAKINFKYDSFESFETSMLYAFQEEKNIKKFIKVLKDFYEFFDIIEQYTNPMMYTGLKKVKSYLRYAGLLWTQKARKYIHSILKYGLKSSKDFVDDFFPEGSEAYKFFRTYGNPNQSAIVLGAMISEFIKDKWYPEGGEQNFANVLAERAKENGAKILYNTMVNGIIIENGIAVGVKTKKENYYANNIVLGCDIGKVFNKMIKDKSSIYKNFYKRLNKAEVSESLFTIYLGLKCDADVVEKSLGGNRFNYVEKIVIKDTTLCNNIDYFKDVTISLFSPSVLSKDISGKGYSSITVQCLCSGSWMNHWGNGDTTEYNKLKNMVKDQLMVYVKKAIPDLVDKIEYIECATPRTYERYTLNTNGAYCAWSWEPGKSFFNDFKIHVKTPIKKLYCCSDWCYSIGGMVSAMLGARIIANKYIKGKVKR